MYNPLVKAAEAVGATPFSGRFGSNIPKTDKELQLEQQVAQAEAAEDSVRAAQGNAANESKTPASAPKVTETTPISEEPAAKSEEKKPESKQAPTKVAPVKPPVGFANKYYAGNVIQNAARQAEQLRNASFLDQVQGVGLVNAFKNHLPKWQQWLGANTLIDGVPNWALLAGGAGVGGLGLMGLRSLLSKSASARAMQAEDPTLMGTVTPARPTITTGNGMSRLMSIISNGCECNCNYGSNMPKSAGANRFYKGGYRHA